MDYGIFYIVNIVLAISFTIIFGYQLVFTIIGLFVKANVFSEAKKQHRYAYIISARNEANVIHYLIDSIKKQNYPAELIDVFVVADNCTDNTAEIARKHGAIVYERFNQHQVGKGYALDFLFNKIMKDYGDFYYDAFLIFDADNILTENYTLEMNKAFDSGKQIITSYRHSKNWHYNWLTSSYGLCFMRECRFLHHPRSRLNIGTFISGTGFLVSAEIIRKHAGWKCQLLTEDIEFSLQSLIAGQTVSYCDAAIFYDEQPTTFRASWNQRLRWCKGFYQCFTKYGIDLFKGIFSREALCFSFYDIFIWVSPLPLISAIWGVCYNLTMLYGAIVEDGSEQIFCIEEWRLHLFMLLFFTFVFTWVIASLVIFKEWSRIGGTLYQKGKAIFFFPFFILTYIPLSIIALFINVSWKPIAHTCSASVEDVDKSLT